MVKVTAPLLSLRAHGWLGQFVYRRLGLVSTSYPIGFFNFRYGLIAQAGFWADKRIAWAATNWTWDGFRVNVLRSFLSFYYSPQGWCYQSRRTWHGIISSAIHPPISVNPKNPYQLVCQNRFYAAVKAWQSLTEAQKDIYRAWTYPVHASGYNRFLSWFMNSRLDHLGP